MSKVTLQNVASLTNQPTALAAMSGNNAAIQSGFDNTLSRDGTAPNQMGANLDMNNFQILNLPAPASPNAAARLADVQAGVGTGGGGNVPSGNAGGIPYYINATTLGSTPNLQAGFLVVGGGGTGPSASTIASLSTSALSIVGTGTNLPQFILQNNAANGSAPFHLFEKTRSSGAVQSGDALGTILWQGFAGTSLQNTAEVVCQVTGSPTSTGVPVTLSLVTTDSAGNQHTGVAVGPTGLVSMNNGASIVTPAGTASGLSITQAGSGGNGSSGIAYNSILINGDNYNAGTNTALSFGVAQETQIFFGGTSCVGGREAIFANCILNSPTATSTPSALRFYTALSGQAQAFTGDGGVLPGSPKGKMYGSNEIGALSTGATGFEQVAAGYDQIYCLTGSSLKTKSIRSFIYGGLTNNTVVDAVQGSTYDSALMIGAETGAVAGGKNGLLIGDMFGVQPLATNATIVNLSSTTGTPTFSNGVDFSLGTFSGSAFKSPGFSVDGTGNVTVSGIVGATAGIAATAGKVGELISSTVSQGSSVPLSYGTVSNVTFVTLTPGDWDVGGSIYFALSATATAVPTVNFMAGEVSTTNAALDSNAVSQVMFGANPFPYSPGQVGMAAATIQVNVSTSTPVYLNARCDYAIGTAAGTNIVRAYGNISARRRR